MTLVAEFLLPPTSLGVLALLALLWRGRWARVVAGGLVAALVLLSTPVVGALLIWSIDLPAEGAAVEAGADGPEPGAIVILSADVVRTGEAGGTDLGPMTLERERAGAALERRTGLPVLVTGGIVTAPPPVAALMVRSMVVDFRIPVRWAEVRSTTTWENARFSEPLLREGGVKRVYLVTHAWHMRRALLAFRRAGLDPVPVVVRRDPWPRFTPLGLMLRTSAWEQSYLALHEWTGLLFYWLRT